VGFVVKVPIAHAEEVEQVFDAISYCKGASVVRMLYAVLGHDDFRKGLQLYMNRSGPLPCMPARASTHVI
jgi:aminopeptidase N